VLFTNVCRVRTVDADVGMELFCKVGEISMFYGISETGTGSFAGVLKLVLSFSSGWPLSILFGQGTLVY
jgi:hypothetical protein